MRGGHPGEQVQGIGLWTCTTAAEFRNLKVWTLSTGLPV
jgi:hypothetical protein